MVYINMNKLFLLFLLFLLFTTLTFSVYAGDITPYGASCPKCGAYGHCKKPISYQEAIRAVESFYAERGLSVTATVVRHNRRFSRIDIYKEGELVDRILLDRKTGRIRSIY